MSNVDISVLTSISESFPYSILEGARFQKATVSTRVGGIPDLIRDRVDGLLFDPGDAERLAAHILLLAADAGMRRSLGNSLYERAMSKFSLNTMCTTQLEIYRAVHAKAKSRCGDAKAKTGGANAYDILISGYYGFNNIGDDAMLMGIIDSIRCLKPDVRFAILSRTPVQTALTYRVNTFNRLNLFRVLRTMKHSGLFIYGGGNIIQDSTSTRSLFFYLAITLMANWMRTKVMFFGNGFGPLLKPLNRKFSGKVLNHTDIITVREELSLRELESLSVTRPDILLTADPALLVTQTAGPEIVDAIFQEEGIPAAGTYIGFSVRDHLAAGRAPEGEGYLLAIARAADAMAERYGIVPVFIPMEYPKDVYQISKVLALMKTKGYLVKNKYSVPQILGIVSRMSMMVAMRLHALIFAANLGVPVVSIEYQPKIEGFIQYIEQDSAGKMEHLQFDALFALMESVWANRDGIREQLAATMGDLREKAFHNAEIAVRLISGQDGHDEGGGHGGEADAEHDAAERQVGK